MHPFAESAGKLVHNYQFEEARHTNQSARHP
jgi:hypothetical protein